ncbi:2-C-methyl-D-erythritol 2,4-cyclodiphosphate synthase, putative [Ricinus communis]|uniref:2-C-methyl-D-erythritol 2,4-cyclodiphosphate synthase n=1 Tax=Ricinus communis TaxID=3988 RepID=B9RCH5_RICCO|nr:2-C-methyl-D-erythritol 2,4-cyclodiphosphate synthase, putative [Ricinus communis]
MATHLCTSYSPITTSKITNNNNNKVLSLPLKPRNAKGTTFPLSLRTSTRLSISAVAGNTAVQVDGPTTSRDVLLHCVVDAILGALGLPDIGQIFPDSDPKWKGAPSSVFIKEAVRLMHEAGYDIGNLDATLILQRPKLSPHKEAIRSNLCELLGADPSVINLKAKTHEKVDSLGENRSIAAHTVMNVLVLMTLFPSRTNNKWAVYSVSIIFLFLELWEYLKRTEVTGFEP